MLPLQGGRNFRDLGGYVAVDGRRVQWGKLYRSGVMSYLTEEDQAYLEPIGVRVLCDFRSTLEREAEPTHWMPADVEVMSWNYDRRKVSLKAYLNGKEFTEDLGRQTIIHFYRRFPTVFREQYSALFVKLANGDLPLVFNCSAGKDRTGLAAALVLSALGVSFEQVLEDYALTDSVVDLEKALFEHPRGSVGLDEDHSFMANLDRKVRAPMLRALPEYLRIAFDQIDLDYGSIDAYLRDGLGVSDAMIENIRTNLLEA